jgi:predicted translin family RNA/ssDNA-binding protein
MPNIKVDWNQVSREVAKLGEDIFQKRIKGATDDALDFLKKVEKDVIKLNLQLTAGQITKEEFDDLMSDQKALAKMEALKQKGLTQVAIDQFVNGAIDILVSAAISAIP